MSEKPYLPALWLQVIVCMLVISIVSSFPGSSLPSVFSFQDILYHFFIYAILGILFARALGSTVRAGSVAVIAATVIFASLYGLADEFHQSFVPGRSSSLEDVITDLAGAFSGGLSWKFFIR